MVIVPTARHGDQFRRRLVEHVGAALALRVATVAQLARELAPGTRIIAPSLATELVARVASDQMALGPASYFRPIDETPGLVATLARAVDELIGEGVDPDALRGAVPEGPLAGLAAVNAAVVSELAARGWTCPAAAPRAAAGARAGSLPGLVLVDGFAFLRSLELELLGALAGGPTWSSRSTPTRALAAPTRSPSSPLGSPLRAASGHRHRRLPPS